MSWDTKQLMMRELSLSKRVGNSVIIHAIFVDDVLHFSDSPCLLDEFEEVYSKTFELKLSHEVDLYLNNRIRVDQSTGTITMTQTHYIEEILRHSGMMNCKLYYMPMQQCLTSADQPQIPDPS